MSLITHAYFEEGDFSKISLLHDTYHHLNACLSTIDNISTSPHLFVGLYKFKNLFKPKLQTHLLNFSQAYLQLNL
jgi:hypothetical protein